MAMKKIRLKLNHIHIVKAKQAAVQLGCHKGAAACDYKTEEVEMDTAMQLLETHTHLAHPEQAQPQAPAAAQVETG